jgi:hypothetical protein
VRERKEEFHALHPYPSATFPNPVNETGERKSRPLARTTHTWREVAFCSSFWAGSTGVTLISSRRVFPIFITSEPVADNHIKYPFPVWVTSQKGLAPRRGVRTIEVPELVAVELRRALRDDPPADLPILVGPRGGVLRRDGWYEQAWRPALVGAGLAPDRFVFHATRHYAVWSMLADGVSLPEVAAYIGDSIEP